MVKLINIKPKIATRRLLMTSAFIYSLWLKEVLIMQELKHELNEPDSLELCSRKEAAEFLKVSISYLDNCTKDLIPRIKIGRRTMYLKSTLVNFVLSNQTLGGPKCKPKSQKIKEQLKDKTVSKI